MTLVNHNRIVFCVAVPFLLAVFMASAFGNVPKSDGLPQLLDESRALGNSYDEILRSPRLRSPAGESWEDKAKRLRIIAEAGDATAQLGLAYLYANGLGLPKK